MTPTTVAGPSSDDGCESCRVCTVPRPASSNVVLRPAGLNFGTVSGVLPWAAGKMGPCHSSGSSDMPECATCSACRPSEERMPSWISRQVCSSAWSMPATKSAQEKRRLSSVRIGRLSGCEIRSVCGVGE